MIAGPLFNHRVVGANIAADSIIAIATSGPRGEPEIRASKFASLHMNDQPTQLGVVGTPNVSAAPAVSMYQTADYALRPVSRLSCVAAPGTFFDVGSIKWPGEFISPAAANDNLEFAWRKRKRNCAFRAIAYGLGVTYPAEGLST